MADFIFAEEPEDELQAAQESENEQTINNAWQVLIVDDEPMVHDVTKTVLKSTIIDGRKLKFISAYSGKEAIEILTETNKIAVILLDVVMETNEAGLDACRHIREELKNDIVRIILRTGQPGSAPQKKVILKYRINDYKEKTELSSDKLFSSIVTAIRSYQDLVKLEQSKIGLQKVIEATKCISQEKSIKLFMEGILAQLALLVDVGNRSLVLKYNRSVDSQHDADELPVILQTYGDIEDLTFSDLSSSAQSLIIESCRVNKDIYHDNHFVGCFNFGSKKQYILYLNNCSNLTQLEIDLLDIFSGNIRIALDNLFLNQDIIDTQTELIEKLGEVVEKRSSEASRHVHRVARMSYELAIDYGLSMTDAQLIKAASPMHDIGKIGISDAILLKPGKLTDDEFEIMKQHAQIGYDIFSSSKREVLKAAAIIASRHHEKYDGSGYPAGDKGEDIHIYGRIAAVADVFDALYNKRCYKEAWPLKQILEYFERESGKHFDPKLAKILIDNVEKYEEFAKRH